MSFSGSVSIPKPELPSDSVSTVKEALAGMNVTGNDDCPVERNLAVSLAKQSAEELLLRGVFGRVEAAAWTVSISGHVNPDNTPREGWSNDYLSINISQQKG